MRRPCLGGDIAIREAHGVGHMPHRAAPEIVVAAIEELVGDAGGPSALNYAQTAPLNDKRQATKGGDPYARQL
jgi:hypothetical protein